MAIPKHPFRIEAERLGLRTFVSGVPCKRGHVGERFSKTGACVPCIAVSRRSWAAANPEKLKRQRRTWRFANLEEARKAQANRSRAWRTANPKENKKRIAVWKAANIDRVRQIDAVRSAAWKKANREKTLAQIATYRARKQNTYVHLTKEEKAQVIEIYRQCAMMTELTGVQYHVDHKIALANGGPHHPDNLQLLPAIENLKKGAKAQTGKEPP